jgi:hypothetical protein
MTVGTWYKTAVTWTGSTITLYIAASGSSLTQVGTGTLSITANVLRIGESIYGGEWLNGCLANFKHYSFVLTTAEMEAELANYAVGLGSGGGSTPPPASQEPYNEGNGGGGGSTGGQTLGVGGVATPAGATLATGNSTSTLNITSGGTSTNPKVYDGKGFTSGRINVTVSNVVVQNYRIDAGSQYGILVDDVDNVTIQNNDIKGVEVSGDGDLNAISIFGNNHKIRYNTMIDFVSGDPGGSHTDGIQTWVSSSHPVGSTNWEIVGNKMTGPHNPSRTNSVPSIHQCIMAEGYNLGGNSGGNGDDPDNWVIAENEFLDSWNQCIKLDGVDNVNIMRNKFIGSSTKIMEVTGSSSNVKYYSDNISGSGSYGSIGMSVTSGAGPATPGGSPGGGGGTAGPPETMPAILRLGTAAGLTKVNLGVGYKAGEGPGPGTHVDYTLAQITAPLSIANYAAPRLPNGAVRLTSYVGAATTSGGTAYSRVEYRELQTNGTSLASWSSTSDTHYVWVHGAVIQVSPGRPHVVLAQIHDGSDDVATIRWEGGTVVATYGDTGRPGTLATNVPLGSLHQWMLKTIRSGSQTIIQYFWDDMTNPKATQSYAGGSGNFFKFGNYNQAQTSNGGINGEAFIVDLYDAEIWHTGYAQPTARNVITIGGGGGGGTPTPGGDIVRAHFKPNLANNQDYSGNGRHLTGGAGSLTEAGPSGIINIEPIIIDLPGVDVVPTGLAPIATFAQVRDLTVVDIVVSPLLVSHHVVVNLPVFTITILPIDVLPAGAFVVPYVEIDVEAFNVFPVGVAGIVDIRILPLRTTRGFSPDDVEAPFVRPIYVQPPPQTTRFIAQSILTKRFLHWDLPISDAAVTYTLSGPTVITGRFNPERLDMQEIGLEPWGTWIHMEDNGIIRASGILQPQKVEQAGEAISIEALGPSSYPVDTPFLNELSLINADPADIVRAIWAHLQGYPDGNLGVVVTGTTPVRIGKPEPPAPPEGQEPDPNTKDDKPYSLVWWEGPDCGTEIANLAKATPFDFLERSEWNADKTDVVHYIDISHPRIGRRLNGPNDPRFIEGENIISGVGPQELSNYYASEVYLFGKGEGRTMVRGYAGRPNEKGRVRRVHIIDDSMIGDVLRANLLSSDELGKRNSLIEIDTIEVDGRHENARLGTFRPGDDILVIARAPWFGMMQQWSRIVSYTFNTETESVAVELKRSDSFTA